MSCHGGLRPASTWPSATSTSCLGNWREKEEEEEVIAERATKCLLLLVV